MSFLSVLIPSELEAVQQAEAVGGDIPTSFEAFCREDGPRPYRRFYRTGEVLDFLAHEGDEQNHAEFERQVAPLLERYNRALGVGADSKFWHSILHALPEVGQFPVRQPGTSGAVMVTVHYPTVSLDTLKKVEADRPDLMEGFAEALRGNGLIAHSRFHRDGEVLDLDEFASEAGFDAFLENARDLITEYDGLAGDETIGTVWRCL